MRGASRRSLRIIATRCTRASISPTIRWDGRSTPRKTTCARASPPGTVTMGGAWDAWAAEMSAYRARLAVLLGAPRGDCIVFKTSAGQGLRAILNTFDAVPRVVSTRGEFDSLDLILREYARRGRIALSFVEPNADGRFDSADLLAAIGPRVDLVVLSQVIFNTGQRMRGPAGDRRGHASCRRTDPARYLSCTRRLSVRCRRARCRLRGWRRLQVFAWRSRRLLPVPASAASRGAPAHARYRLVRQAQSLRLRAT